MCNLNFAVHLWGVTCHVGTYISLRTHILLPCELQIKNINMKQRNIRHGASLSIIIKRVYKLILYCKYVSTFCLRSLHQSYQNSMHNSSQNNPPTRERTKKAYYWNVSPLSPTDSNAGRLLHSYNKMTYMTLLFELKINFNVKIQG